MPYVGQKNAEVTVLHVVLDFSRQPVSGEAANLTYVLRDESGNTQTTGVTATEQGATGYYDLVFTPDLVGIWTLTVTDPPGTAGNVTDYQIQVVQSAAGLTPSGTYLTTLANFKERISVTSASNDTYYTNIIARASAMIESMLNRHVVEASYTEYFDGGGKHLFLREGPLSSVSQVNTVTYDSGGSETTSSYGDGSWIACGLRATGWRLPGYITGNSTTFTGITRGIQVIYTGGWTTVPYDIEEACLHACVWMWNTSKDTASAIRNVGDSSTPYRSHAELMTNLEQMLAPYTAVRV